MGNLSRFPINFPRPGRPRPRSLTIFIRRERDIVFSIRYFSHGPIIDTNWLPVGTVVHILESACDLSAIKLRNPLMSACRLSFRADIRSDHKFLHPGKMRNLEAVEQMRDESDYVNDI